MARKFKKAHLNKQLKRKFPYDPFPFFATIIGWGMALVPKIQKAAGERTPVMPAKIVAVVVEHFFGTDEHPSALWVLLMSAKPPGISQELHEAIAELVSDAGLMLAQVVLYITERAWMARERKEQAPPVVKDIREHINAMITEYDIEDDVQAILDAA